MRNNIDYMMFFMPHSIQEHESFIEKFVSKSHVKQVREILLQAYQGQHDFILYNPHILEWKDRFCVGDRDAFIGGKMRPVFPPDFELESKVKVPKSNKRKQ